MYRLFRLKVDGLACFYGHALRLVTDRLWFACLDGIEERWHHCVHKLCMSGGVLVIGVVNIAVSPLTVALVDRTENVGRGDVPLMDEQVELLDVVIVVVVIVTTRVVVHHHRNLPVCAYLIY